MSGLQDSAGFHNFDAPLGNWDKDLYDRKMFPTKIARFYKSIKTQDNSVVMAITGPWGQGKPAYYRRSRQSLRLITSITT